MRITQTRKIVQKTNHSVLKPYQLFFSFLHNKIEIVSILTQHINYNVTVKLGSNSKNR